MTWYIVDVNPEPWRVPPMSVGRSKQGKSIVIAGRDQQLHAFQEAIKDAIGVQPFIEGPVRVTFYFWRVRSEYTTHQSRTVRKHEVDATNMQKACEDALQGILFANDKDVVDIRSVIVEQGPNVRPRIVMSVEECATPDWLSEIPIEVVADMLDEPTLFESNVWPPIV